MKRRDYRKTKQRTRELQNIIIIICEGETEVKYFNGFKTRYSNMRIRPLNPNYTDAKNLVDEAIKEQSELKKKIDNSIKSHSVWCAFDVDEKDSQAIREAIEKADKHLIKIALSNPCLELWYLIHYQNQTAGIERHDALRQLRTYIPNYEKGDDEIYSLIRDHQHDAIRRAKELNEQHTRNDINLLSHASNPSSQVFELVDHINAMTEKNLQRYKNKSATVCK